jgi:sterol desaturase/sphingolipid hydroxylase (fatty acid hydroxylase superfamily)
MSSFLASSPQVSALLIQLAKSLAILAALVAVLAPLEKFFAVRPVGLFHKGWTVDLGWYFVNGFTLTLLLGPPAALIGWGVHQLLPEQITEAGAQLPLAARMAAAIVVGEIGFYWGHRWSHEIPLLWRFHAVHHSATELNFLVNTRAHPVDLVFGRLCGLTLLFATGLVNATGPNPTLIPLIVLFTGSMWSFFVHANLRLRLGWFEQVLATPAFHHWHHTYEDHKDHNYAPMLPVMDRIFGTLYLPKTWPEAYGTATPMPDSVIGQLLEPFAPVEKPAQQRSAS